MVRNRKNTKKEGLNYILKIFLKNFVVSFSDGNYLDDSFICQVIFYRL